MKVKHKSKGREMQTQLTPRRVIEEETEELREKSPRDPPSRNRSTSE